MRENVRRLVAALMVAWLFLTRVPLLTRWSRWAGVDETPFYRSVPFFPWIGLVLGGLAMLADAGLGLFFSPFLSALLLVVLFVVLTGGLHLDGWMDTADGLLSGREREKVLAIMKDSRVGAFGALALVLLLLLKWGGLAELGTNRGPLLLLMPAAGRVAMTGCVLFWPDARSGQGIGSMFRPGPEEGGKIRRLRFWSLFSMFAAGLVIGLICGIGAFAVFCFAVAFGWFMAGRIARRLGGLTGDVYGAVNEAVEVAAVYFYLVLMTAVERW